MPRRKWLMIRYTLASLGIVTLAAAVVFMTRSRTEPYTPGDQVEGITRSLERQIPSEYSPVAFTEVGQQSGIDFTHFYWSRSTQLPEDMGSGAAWGDYDKDGDPDLYVCNIAGPLTMDPANSPAGNQLYRNNGNGTFTNVTADAGVGFKGWSMGAAWGDYDGDADLDLWVTNFSTNMLYRNNGDGTFTNVSHAAHVGGIEGFWTGASWSDFDLDGDLDIYVCGYVQYRFDPADRTKVTLQYKADVPFTLNPSSYPPERNLLYRNNGNGTFTEIAKQSGVDNPTGRSLSAAWSDFDLDGRPDLYVANDVSDNVMYRNMGNGKFVDVSHSAWVADYRGAMGLAVGDWDNDGDFDIFITHWIAQENALFNNLIYAFDNPDSKAKQMLFMDIADQNGLGQIALDFVGWGTSFFDYDNDGRLDLLVVNGSTFQDDKNPKLLVPMRTLLFWNKGEEDGFFEVGEASGEFFSRTFVGRGSAFADYDNDGDVDVLVLAHSGPALLLRNDGGNRNNWLKVRLRAAGKNHFGLGAKVELVVQGKKQIQELGLQPSYLSQNALEAYFGLGQAHQVDHLIVTFPSGRVIRRDRIAANQTVVIQENE
ncbi:MAG: FG-GAP-like repeat-containing protein [Acidobacteriota bacterium]